MPAYVGRSQLQSERPPRQAADHLAHEPQAGGIQPGPRHEDRARTLVEDPTVVQLIEDRHPGLVDEPKVGLDHPAHVPDQAGVPALCEHLPDDRFVVTDRPQAGERVAPGREHPCERAPDGHATVVGWRRTLAGGGAGQHLDLVAACGQGGHHVGGDLPVAALGDRRVVVGQREDPHRAQRGPRRRPARNAGATAARKAWSVNVIGRRGSGASAPGRSSRVSWPATNARRISAGHVTRPAGTW